MRVDVGRWSHPNARDDADGHEGGDDRAAAIAEEGERQTDDRHKTDANADVDEDLEDEHRGNADAIMRLVKSGVLAAT